ncbi:MAG: hypothetical protein IJ424_02515 [Oscillospiraceae bacterium]|nr:hypothetical protein [Oscillospiraceae bacterium]
MRKFTPKLAALLTLRISVLILTVAATVLIYVYLSPFKTVMYILIALFWAVALAFVLILLPAYFRRTVMYLSPTELSLHTGMIFLTREHMRVSAVQYISMITLPFSSITGFNFLAVHGLGGTMILPFLSSEDALTLADSLQLEIQKR